MQLKLHKVKVRDVRWGDVTKVQEGVLYVDKVSALEAVKDDAFAKAGSFTHFPAHGNKAEFVLRLLLLKKKNAETTAVRASYATGPSGGRKNDHT